MFIGFYETMIVFFGASTARDEGRKCVESRAVELVHFTTDSDSRHFQRTDSNSDS